MLPSFPSCKIVLRGEDGSTDYGEPGMTTGMRECATIWGLFVQSVATSQIRVRINENTVVHMEDGILDRKREKKERENKGGNSDGGADVERGRSAVGRRCTSSRTVYICHEASRDKGWCCRWVQVNLWPPDEILFPQQRLV